MEIHHASTTTHTTNLNIASKHPARIKSVNLS
jgi:hypothetical protein